MKNLFLTISIVSSFLFASCSSDDDQPIVQNTVEAPATYKFMRGTESTVSFDGQTTRILMAGETANAFMDFDNATETSLLAMFNHQAGDTDFSDADLNDSDKNLRKLETFSC